MNKLIALFFFVLSSLTMNAQQRLLIKDSLKYDLDVLYRMFDEVHPGTYRYLTPTELQTHFQALYTQLPDTISEGDFMIRLAQTVSQVKCGHTYLNPWNMKKEIRNRLFGDEIFFPIGIEALDGRFFITENVSGHSDIQLGAEIISLDGITMSVVYDSLKTVAKRDGNNKMADDSYFSVTSYGSRDWNAFELYYALFFPAKEGKVTLVYQNYGADQPKKVDLNLLSQAERTQKMNAAYGDLSQTEKEWKLTILDDKRAILRIGTFAIWNWKDFDHKAWLDSTFTLIQEASIETLIVDIRGNGGGDANAKDDLLSYLIKENLERKADSRSLIRTAKISEELHPYCDTWLKMVLEGLPEELYEPYDSLHLLFKQGGTAVTIIPKEKAFKGNTFMLGDGSNTSATYTMLQLAKTYGFATFVGSESGGNLQGINGSQYVFFYLPNSQMEVDIPLIFTQPIQEMPDEGVKPDIEVKKTQAAIALDADPVLDAAQ